MKNPRNPSDSTAEPVRWSVFMFRNKGARLGTVWAHDEAEALEKAIKELDIPEAERWRISVRQE
jgi:hypothetical protein